MLGGIVVVGLLVLLTMGWYTPLGAKIGIFRGKN